MRTVNTQLADRARSIFANLGYTVEGEGSVFTAEREWKLVHVNIDHEFDGLPTSGEFHCFVSLPESADDLERRLKQVDPDYEWAIIVVDGEEYEVERAPPGPVVTV